MKIALVYSFLRVISGLVFAISVGQYPVDVVSRFAIFFSSLMTVMRVIDMGQKSSLISESRGIPCLFEYEFSRFLSLKLAGVIIASLIGILILTLWGDDYYELGLGIVVGAIFAYLVALAEHNRFYGNLNRYHYMLSWISISKAVVGLVLIWWMDILYFEGFIIVFIGLTSIGLVAPIIHTPQSLRSPALKNLNLAVAGAWLFEALSSRFDVLYGSQLLGQADLATYYYAIMLASSVGALGGAVGMHVLPTIVGKNQAAGDRYLKKIRRYLLFMSVGILCIWSILDEWLVATIFPSVAKESLSVFYYTLCGSLISLLAVGAGQRLIADRRYRDVFVLGLFFSALKVLAVIFSLHLHASVEFLSFVMMVVSIICTVTTIVVLNWRRSK